MYMYIYIYICTYIYITIHIYMETYVFHNKHSLTLSAFFYCSLFHSLCIFLLLFDYQI